jgi:hypothetical protein
LTGRSQSNSCVQSLINGINSCQYIYGEKLDRLEAFSLNRFFF